MKNSVSPNGPLLASDRRSLGLSVQALLDRSEAQVDSITISRSTVERAERSQGIRVSSLRAIAQLLNHSYERYVSSDALRSAVLSPDLSGKWQGYYLDRSIDLGAAVSHIELDFTQEGGDIVECLASVNEGDSLFEEGLVDVSMINDMIMMRNYVIGWQQPAGVSNTMFKLVRGNEMMDGYTIWYDLDTQKIECSSMILARCDSRFFKQYKQIAYENVLSCMPDESL